MSTITTIKQIASRLNISASSVSRALHGHPSIGLRTKMRVAQLAKEMDYEPNQKAIFFQKGKTFTIGVILPELSEAFFSSAISGIEDTASKNNYSVLIGQSHNGEEREKEIVNMMKKYRVDGLIISMAKKTVNYDHFEMLKKNGIPIIFFDCIPNLVNINYVACDMQEGAGQAVKFLLKKGHRAIGMINGPEKLLACQQRVEGYISALQKQRLKYDPSLIVSSDLSREGTAQALDQLLAQKRKPTAIVLFNDYVALDAIQIAKEKKLKINEDICFVTCGNGSILDYIAFPPLAALEQFPYQQGQKAMESLLEILGKQQLNSLESMPYSKIIMESKLIIHDNRPSIVHN